MDKQKILIVEDDTSLGELLTVRLVKEGFITELAIDGENAIESFRKEKPALILLDIILPGIDGFEVLKQVREDPNLKKIPVLILSNLEQKDDIQRGLSLGAQKFLIKASLDLDGIIENVKTALGK